MTDQQSTDILARIAAELEHPVMAFSGSGDVPAAVLRDAAAEIERLRAALTEIEVMSSDEASRIRATEALHAK